MPDKDYWFKILVYDTAGQTTASNEVHAKTNAAGNDLPAVTTICYDYDAVGNRVAMVDPRGVTTYEYDVVNRLTKVTEPLKKQDGTFMSVSYQYNAVGQRTRMDDHFGGVTTYAYDAAGRETQVTDRNGGVTTFEYDASGNRTRMVYPNGMVTTYSYNNRNWLLYVHNHKSDGTMIADFDYTYDAVGNRTAVAEKHLDIDNTTLHEATVTYGYDNLYRLTSEHRTGWVPYWNEYDYDPVGNRLALRVKDGQGNVTGTTPYTYNNMNQMLTAGNITFTYDLAGNQTSKTVNGPTATMTWDFRNKMIGNASPEVTLEYRYDGDGLRTHRQTSDPSDGPNAFLFDRNLFSMARLLFEVRQDGTIETAYVHDAGGNLIGRRRMSGSEGTVMFYAFNALGSTAALVDSTGTLTAGYICDAWGTELANEGDQENPFGYVGRLGYYHDRLSGLSLLGERWYIRDLGLFASMEKGGRGAWYLYGSANPVLHVDPAGLTPVSLAFLPVGSLLGLNVNWTNAIQCLCCISSWVDIALPGFPGLIDCVCGAFGGMGQPNDPVYNIWLWFDCFLEWGLPIPVPNTILDGIVGGVMSNYTPTSCWCKMCLNVL